MDARLVSMSPDTELLMAGEQPIVLSLKLTLPRCVCRHRDPSIGELVRDEQGSAQSRKRQGQPDQRGAKRNIDCEVASVGRALIVDRFTGVVVNGLVYGHRA